MTNTAPKFKKKMELILFLSDAGNGFTTFTSLLLNTFFLTAAFFPAAGWASISNAKLIFTWIHTFGPHLNPALPCFWVTNAKIIFTWIHKFGLHLNPALPWVTNAKMIFTWIHKFGVQSLQRCCRFPPLSTGKIPRPMFKYIYDKRRKAKGERKRLDIRVLNLTHRSIVLEFIGFIKLTPGRKADTTALHRICHSIWNIWWVVFVGSIFQFDTWQSLKITKFCTHKALPHEFVCVFPVKTRLFIK